MLKALRASPIVSTLLQRFKGGQPRRISSKHGGQKTGNEDRCNVIDEYSGQKKEGRLIYNGEKIRFVGKHILASAGLGK